MTRAFNSLLLPGAMDSLGRMLDYSVHSLRIDAAVMMELFSASNTGEEFSRGDIRLLAGMSGIELAYEILERSGVSYERIPQRHASGPSSEYICGGALARIQWESSAGFAAITEVLPVNEMIAEFAALRTELLAKLPLDASPAGRTEALQRLGAEFMESKAALFRSSVTESTRASDTPLKKARIKNGLSQRALAEASGVPLRTIQQYEQRQKDLSKARSEYLIMLSGALNCPPASLLETV